MKVIFRYLKDDDHEIKLESNCISDMRCAAPGPIAVHVNFAQLNFSITLCWLKSSSSALPVDHSHNKLVYHLFDNHPGTPYTTAYINVLP